MKKIVSFTSTDGLLLHGLYFNSGFDKSVIHVHGLAGNFYSSTYHKQLAKIYRKMRYNYLSFNNRGSEYIKQLKNIQTEKSEFYGYSFELFDQSDRDILGAIEFLKDNGIKKYILQGHSSGCQKIIYTVVKHRLKTEKIILLSPCDDVGLAIDNYSLSIFKKKIKEAQDTTSIFLPQNFFFNLPLAPATFLSHFGPDNQFDIFHYYRPLDAFEKLKLNTNPTLVVFGEKDYVINFNTVKDIYKKFDNYQLFIIPNSDHKYHTFEKELAKIIFDYVHKSN